MLAIMLALGAAVGWGTSDFLGGLRSRTAPLLSVLLISQVASLALLSVITAVRGSGLPSTGALAWAALAGVAETAAAAALYRGLAVGTISVVAVVASTAPVVPLIVGLALGEVPGTLQFAGLALAFAGLVISSYQSNGGRSGAGVLTSVGLGLIAALGFGVYFLAMERSSSHDVGWALLTARLTAVGFIAAAILIRRDRIGVTPQQLPGIAVIGVLIVMADALYATASTQGLLGVVAVLGALHTLVTIALARIFLNEHLGRPQLVGAAAALLGVLAISAG